MTTDNEQNHLAEDSSYFILNCSVSVESAVTYIINWTLPNDLAKQASSKYKKEDRLK